MKEQIRVYWYFKKFEQALHILIPQVKQKLTDKQRFVVDIIRMLDNYCICIDSVREELDRDGIFLYVSDICNINPITSCGSYLFHLHLYINKDSNRHKFDTLCLKVNPEGDISLISEISVMSQMYKELNYVGTGVQSVDVSNINPINAKANINYDSNRLEIHNLKIKDIPRRAPRSFCTIL